MARNFKTTQDLINESIWNTLFNLKESLASKVYWADDASDHVAARVLRDVQQSIEDAMYELDPDR